MKLNNLGLRVSLCVALMLAVIIGGIVYIVSVRSTELITDVANKTARASNIALRSKMQSLELEALARSYIIASSYEVIDAVENNDESALKDLVRSLGVGVDTATITDKYGNVLARKNSDQKGDSIFGQDIVAKALTTGIESSMLAKGAKVGMSTRASVAIKDLNGNIIGAVFTSHDLSNPVYVDSVKESSTCEVKIFDDSTRMSSTLIDENGERVIGTKADEAVVEAVINNRQDYTKQIHLFGRDLYAYYSPIIKDDTVIGMLFTGAPLDGTMQKRQEMLNMVLLVGIICGALGLLLVIFLNMRAADGLHIKLDRSDKIGNEKSPVSSSTRKTKNVKRTLKRV